MSRLKRLVVEVHRRSLWQVLLIYAATTNYFNPSSTMGYPISLSAKATIFSATSGLFPEQQASVVWARKDTFNPVDNQICLAFGKEFILCEIKKFGRFL